jgi:hypothetical protein
MIGSFESVSYKEGCGGGGRGDNKEEVLLFFERERD